MLRKSLGARCSQGINTCKWNREENWTVVPIQKLLAVRSPGTRCWGSPWDEQTSGGHLLVTPHGKTFLKGRHKQHISVSIRVHPWGHLDPYTIREHFLPGSSGKLRRRSLVGRKNYLSSTAVNLRLQLILIVSLLYQLFGITITISFISAGLT